MAKDPLATGPKAPVRYHERRNEADHARHEKEMAAGRRQGNAQAKAHMNSKRAVGGIDNKAVKLDATGMVRPAPRGKVTDGGYC
jgi:hypothetical protein